MFLIYVHNKQLKDLFVVHFDFFVSLFFKFIEKATSL